MNKLSSTFLLVIFTFAAVVGCMPTGTTNTPGKSGESTKKPLPSGVRPASTPGATPPATTANSQSQKEYWDAIYIRDTKVGYARTRVEPIERDGTSLVKYTQDTKLSVRRFGATVIDQTTKFEAIETPDGQVVEFLSTATLGRSPTETRGRVEDGKLITEVTTQGKTIFDSIDWNPEWGSFFAVEQSLKDNPIKPGEQRSFKALMPMATAVAVSNVTIAADDWEQTRLRSGDAKLLKIHAKMEMGGQGNTALQFDGWVDEAGTIRKQLVPGLNMEYYRTTKAEALGLPDNAGVDLAIDTSVKVNRQLPNPHATRRIVYRVKLTDADPTETFPTSESQQTKSTGDHQAEITVTSIDANTPEKLPVESKQPVAEDLAPNNLIQSDDERIIRMAAAIAPDETDNFRVAVAMEKFTSDAIAEKNFSTAFASAAEVAQSLEGDCTEHAVLLAALCRARKIPARVAIGLIYYRPISGFAYHMWTEVWTGERWVPLDATLGRGGIGAAHLKLADSNLEGASAFGTFLPVANVLGKLEIELVDVE